MKKILLITFLLLTFNFLTFSQGCLPEGIHFFSQEEIDNFQFNYPGCTEIEGDVWIDGNAYINNLNGLDVLTSIDGNLYIVGNLYLPDLTGLNALTSIGGDIIIGDSFVGNVYLTSLEGLNNLTFIGGSVHIWSNHSLTTLNGLESLTTIGGVLEIIFNENLISLSGLENINPGSITDISIFDNYALSTCDVQSICDYLVALNGTVEIYNNAPGCNSIEEVEEACEALSHCLPEGITFSAQSQIDNFPMNYPGCTEIEGNVIIGDWGSTDITNLDSLIYITKINGGLSIESNPLLTSLTGLNNLTTIGGYLMIGNWEQPNINLESLEGLGNLISVEGDVYIESNPLNSLDGLSSLNSVGYHLRISMISNIADLHGLENLNSIGGNLEIISNNNLISLQGIENIEAGTIEGIQVTSNPVLTECSLQSICDYLVAPTGSIWIENNAPGCNSQEEIELACFSCLPDGIIFSSQEQIDNFFSNYPGCLHIQGDVKIDGNYILSLSGLTGLTTIGGFLKIIGNNNLPDFMGLDSLESIGGYLQIAGNPILNSFNGLSSLSTIQEWFSVEMNNALPDLSGLESLSYVGENIQVLNNNNLVSCEGLENVTNIPGVLGIGGNAALENLLAFQNLEEIGYFLYIVENPQLENLEGLNNLSYIEEDLVIENNSTLQDITALSNLTFVGDYLHIKSNSFLTNLFGLDSINPNSINDLTIIDNPQLQDCDVLSICQYLMAPGGTIEIHDNANGCNSQLEVEEACLTSTDEIKTLKNDIRIFPNPAKKTISIISTNQIKIQQIKIFNQTGALSIEENDPENKMDVSSLGPGLYFVEMKTKKGIKREKLIIQ